MRCPLSLPLVVLSLASTLVACADAATAVATGGNTTSAPPVGTTSAAVTVTTGMTVVDDSATGPENTSIVATDGPGVFDVGSIPDAPLIDTECTKVDFIFIIDNSSSMGAYQTNLVNNFPAFINGIQSVLGATDSYQVGVITTDPYFDNVVGCNQLSSLVVRTGGVNSSDMTCGPYADGSNFMTETDNLTNAFECAARVGTSGSGNERPMQAMVEAVQRLEGGPGECNEGFLRDDALLVIVNIGDENDNSIGTPTDWYNAVVAAKMGIAENVVVVSIIDGPGNGCGFGQSLQRSLFTAMWGANGFEVPICVADYAPYFQEAISIIDVACENFVPPAG